MNSVLAIHQTAPARFAPLPTPSALGGAPAAPSPAGLSTNASSPTVVRTTAPLGADPMEAIATAVTVQGDGTIFREGDPAGHIHKVVRGMVRLHKMLPDGRRQIIGFLEAGDHLGLSFGDTYLFSAEAVVETVVQRIPRARFEAVLDTNPGIQRRLLAMATTELVAAQDQMLLLGRKTACERICSFLLMLSRRRERRLLPGDRVRLPMTRGDIADYLGLTIETVSRTLSKLKAGCLIRCQAE